VWACLVYGQTTLAIQNAALQTQEDGAAVAAGRLFRAGELAYGSFSVANFQKKASTDPAVDETTILLSYRVEALDPAGVAIQAPQAGKIDATVRKEDKEWRPRVRFNLLLPPAAPSGTYRIEGFVKDEFAGKETRVTIPFEVKGYDVAPADKLTIANFRFQRSERASEGAWDPATYRVGETVWVLFDATGFKLGPKNRYDVAYGLAVMDGAGKVLFEQDGVAELTEEPEYPKRGLPGALSVRVAEGTPKTAFQFLVKVTDRVGGETVERNGKFTVE
jgi:hypothetical protein